MSFNADDRPGQPAGFGAGRVFGFPLYLRVDVLIVPILFVIMTGAASRPSAVPTALLLTGIALGSVLAHELGHAFAARRYGRTPIDIVLTGFGGYTRMGRPPPTARAGLLTSLAGPAVGLMIGVVAFAATQVLHVPGLDVFLGWAAEINLVWSVFNLLPIFPLDGGQSLLFLLLDRRVGRAAVRITGRVSVVVVAIVAFIAWRNGSVFTAFIALSTLQSSLPMALQRD